MKDPWLDKVEAEGAAWECQRLVSNGGRSRSVECRKPAKRRVSCFDYPRPKLVICEDCIGWYLDHGFQVVETKPGTD